MLQCLKSLRIMLKLFARLSCLTNSFALSVALWIMINFGLQKLFKVNHLKIIHLVA